MIIPSSQATGYCLGHDKLKMLFNTQIQKNCLGAAWLLSGDKGVGKATFAYYYACILLENLDPFSTPNVTQTSAYTYINQHIHPDFYHLQAEQEQDITIETVRNLTHFLHKTPVLGKRRVAVIDGANFMTRQAANALLKTLEDPPAFAVVFLINHGAVLQTLKSRCQQLVFHPLSDTVTEKIIEPWTKEYSSTQKIMLLKYLRGHPGISKYFSDEKIQILETLQKFETQNYTYSEICTFSETFKDHVKSVQYGILLWIAHRIEEKTSSNNLARQGAELWSEINYSFNEYYFCHTDFSHFMIKIFEKIKQWVIQKDITQN